MSNLSLSLNIDTRTTGSESLRTLSALLDELGNEAVDTQPEVRLLGERINEIENQQTLINNFRVLKAGLEETSAELRATATRTSDLGRQLSQTENPTQSMTRAFARSRQELARLEQTEQSQRLALQQLRGDLSNAGISTNQLNAAQQRLATEFRASEAYADILSDELRQQSQQLRQTTAETERLNNENRQTSLGLNSVSQAGQGFNGQLNKITKGLIAAGAAYVGINTVTNSVKDLLNTGGKFEKLEVQMRGIMGSIEEGDAATEWVKDFAKNTPLQLDGVTKAFIKAKAFGLDPMDGTLQALTDSVSKLGGGQEELEGVVLAVGQAWTKQKLQAEESNQLIERGIPVYELLSTALGKTSAEIQDMASAGEIGRVEITALIDEMAKTSAGSAKSMMSTWDGIVSNLNDNLDKVKDSIAKAGLLDTFKAELSGISAAIDEMAADGSLEIYAKEISDAITGTLTALKNGLITLYSYREEIELLAKTVLGIKLASMFVGVVSNAAAATTAVYAHRAAIIATAASARALAVAFGGVTLAVAAGSFAIVEGTKYLIDYDKSIDAARKSQLLLEESNKNVNVRFKEFSDQIGITVKNMDQLDQLVQDGLVVWNDTKGAYEGVAKAAKEKAEAVKAAREEDRQAILDADPMLAQIDAISKAITKQVAAIEAAAKENTLNEWAEQFFLQFNPSSLEQVATLNGSIQDISASSEQLGDKLQTALIDKLKDLTGNQLLDFQSTAQAAFDAGNFSAKELSNTLSLTLSASLAKVSVDAQVVNGEFTSLGKDVVSTFNAIATNATASGDVIKTAFNAALNKVSTQADLAELSNAWVAYAESANLSVSEIETGLLQTKVRAQDLTGAYELLGITSSEKLQLIAQDHKAAYEQVKIHSTNVNEHKLAVKAWAETEIEAAAAQGRSVDQSLLQAAATVGLTDKIQKMITKLKEESDGLSTNTDQWINRAAVIDSASETISQAYQKQKTAEKEAQESSAKSYGVIMATRDATDLTALSISELNDEIAEQSDRIYKNRQVQSAWWRDIAENQIVFDQQTLAIAKQTLSLRELEQGFESTETPTLAMINNTQNAIDRLDKLDDATLTSLNAQLDSARSKLQSLQENAESALSSVQNELDYLNGNSESIENRAYEASIAALKEQLAAASDYQDSESINDLNQAIALTEQLHQQKLTAIREEAAAAAEVEQSTTTATTATTSAAQTSSTVFVKLELGNSTATIETTEDGKNDLLDLLQQSSLITG